VLSNACAVGFLPKTSRVSAGIPHCFSCEEGQIPEPVRPEAAKLYKQLGADVNVRVVLLVPFAEQLVSGDMEATVRILDYIEAYPASCPPSSAASSSKTVKAQWRRWEAVRAQMSHPAPHLTAATPPPPPRACRPKSIPQGVRTAREPA
jgi:hypothetical protein